MHGDGDDDMLAANENLYSSRTVDTKERNKIMLGGSRGDGKKCHGTPMGLKNSLAGVLGYVAQEIYVVL